jgi:hypothetical protein
MIWVCGVQLLAGPGLLSLWVAVVPDDDMAPDGNVLLVVAVDGTMLLVVAVGEVLLLVVGHCTHHGFWSPFFSKTRKETKQTTLRGEETTISQKNVNVTYDYRIRMLI